MARPADLDIEVTNDPIRALVYAINVLGSVRATLTTADDWRETVETQRNRSLVWTHLEAAQLAVDRVFLLMLRDTDPTGWREAGVPLGRGAGGVSVR